MNSQLCTSSSSPFTLLLEGTAERAVVAAALGPGDGRRGDDAGPGCEGRAARAFFRGGFLHELSKHPTSCAWKCEKNACSTSGRLQKFGTDFGTQVPFVPSHLNAFRITYITVVAHDFGLGLPARDVRRSRDSRRSFRCRRCRRRSVRIMGRRQRRRRTP